MCLAVPGKVMSFHSDAGLIIGKVDFAGTLGKVCLEYVPEVKIGQYVIVHAGFAISIIDEDEARESLALWDEYRSHEAKQSCLPENL